MANLSQLVSNLEALDGGHGGGVGLVGQGLVLLGLVVVLAADLEAAGADAGQAEQAAHHAPDLQSTLPCGQFFTPKYSKHHAIFG